MIRVDAGDTRMVRGRFLRAATDTLFLNDDHIERGMPLSQIKGLWIQRHSSGTGALVGFLLGAVLGGVAVGGLCTGLNEGQSVGCTGPVIFGILAGGGAGALIGVGIGSAIPRWEKRCP